MREVYMNMNPSEIESEYLNGVYNEIANALGIEVAMTLYSTYRGQQITFPVNFFTHEFIASRIVAEYDGKISDSLLQNTGTAKNGSEK